MIDIEESLEGISRSLTRIAHAVSADAARSTDASGGSVDSLTEAVMGNTAGLIRIAEAIEYLADAVRDTGGGISDD